MCDDYKIIERERVTLRVLGRVLRYFLSASSGDVDSACCDGDQEEDEGEEDREETDPCL